MAKEIIKTAYQCEKCGKVYDDERTADICCKVYHCEICGAVAFKYHTICEACKEKRNYEKAEKLTIEEYEAKFTGRMVVTDSGRYYSSVEDLLESTEWCDDAEPPKYCWGTDEIPIEMDADEVLDQLQENANVEDLEFPKSAYEEFRAFAAQWNEKYGTYYYMQGDVVILIPDDLRREYMQDERT